MSKLSAQYERIDFFDEEGSTIVSLAPFFYRQNKPKKRLKPIKVGDQSYFIELGKDGMQSVYTDSGKHVANMQRNGRKIQIIDSAVTTYSIKPIIGFANPSILKCEDSEGTIISNVNLNNKRKLEYKILGENETDLLLMALCIHKYQELLLTERGSLVAMY